MKRTAFLEKIKENYRVHAVCGLLGPRQVGKTTLAKMFAENIPNAQFLDLENPFDLAQLNNPMSTLSDIDSKLIIIDEVL